MKLSHESNNPSLFNRFLTVHPSTGYDRMGSLAVFLLGVLMLAGNHHSAIVYGEVYPLIVFFATFALAMGLAGVIDPRILSSLRRDRGPCPAWLHWIGVVLMLFAGVFAFALLLFVYPR